MNSELKRWLFDYIDFGSIEGINYSSMEGIVVDLFISDRCNLRCKHCYFGDTKMFGRPLLLEEWKNVIQSLYAQGIRHFHISGRESSLDGRVPEIISYIKSLEGTYSGIVSNGTGDIDFYKALIGNRIDYLEFSIDGLAQTHNYIRGKEIFSDILRLIEQLPEHKQIIDISTCLNLKSVHEYISLIELFNSIGITKFFATPFYEKGNGKTFSQFSINSNDFTQLIKATQFYFDEHGNQSIIVKYCIPHEMTYPYLSESTFIHQILVDYLNGKSRLTKNINGNLIQLALNLLDIKFLHNISITSDGEVLPCSDYISFNNYKEYSIGNVLKRPIKEILEKRLTIISNYLNTLHYEYRKREKES